jgi:hypothetical protein
MISHPTPIPFPARSPVDLTSLFGKRVAWSLDRTQILAVGQDDAEVVYALDAQGVPLDQVILSYVPHSNEIIVGGTVGQESQAR